MGRKKDEKLEKLLKRNAKKAKKHGYDRHLYLEVLGLEIERCGTNFCDDGDERSKKWKKERKKYGFDSRETWCLDEIATEWLYERLVAYKKATSKRIDLSFHKFEIDGKEVTQEEAIDEMTSLLRDAIIASKDDVDDAGAIEKKRRAFRIWAEVFPSMWW